MDGCEFGAESAAISATRGRPEFFNGLIATLDTEFEKLSCCADSCGGMRIGGGLAVHEAGAVEGVDKFAVGAVGVG